MSAGIIGLGYVGLTLAVATASNKVCCSHYALDIYKTSGFSFSKSTDVLKEKINTISLLLSASDGKIVYESPVQYIYYDKETGIYCCDEYGNCDTSAEIYHK